MQRGRDHGVPGYNAFREYCGLNRARTWDDLSAAFTNDTLRRYSELYESPDDIDLWSAGISERPIPGSMVGPVFACIMGDTFRNLRQVWTKKQTKNKQNKLAIWCPLIDTSRANAIC